jgi:hypothetical protein
MMKIVRRMAANVASVRRFFFAGSNSKQLPRMTKMTL